MLLKQCNGFCWQHLVWTISSKRITQKSTPLNTNDLKEPNGNYSQFWLVWHRWAKRRVNSFSPLWVSQCVQRLYSSFFVSNEKDIAMGATLEERLFFLGNLIKTVTNLKFFSQWKVFQTHWNSTVFELISVHEEKANQSIFWRKW